MNLEILISFFSVFVALANSIALVSMYIKYVRSIHGVFCSIRANESGEVEIIESLTGFVTHEDME